jgi:Protein of unknown function (DUF1642)
MSKVTVPREVAEAIEYFKAEEYENRDILIRVEEGTFNESYENHVDALQKYSTANYNDLLLALVNGYNVEKTPEEEIRGYYAEVIDLYTHDYSNGLQVGIVYVLDKLGIKIEGVNA